MYSQSTYPYIEISAIPLQGKWLGNLGFRIGQKVIVKEDQGLLTISLMDREYEEI
ncbi:SymE family type I addiction module toxin [Alkaliphilus peptidifermentans]|uniref:SymE family type I addiction module toxin n=1 Tax=Alkaliphilus peptidifermentans TaxID=426129 RepID=UPI000B87DAA5